MGKFFASPPQLPRGLGLHGTGETTAPADRRFSKIITMAWLTLGIASVALALIGVLLLRSERKSTAILHHLNLVSLDLQDVLSDLADAEAEQRGYLLTHRPADLENFQRSRQSLGLEFQRLTALVKNNPVQRQEVERVRYLVQQDLDELQSSITSYMAAGSQAAFAKILTDRARRLTEALRQSITGINEEDEGVLARLVRERRTRLARAMAAVSCALFLAACYLFMGQIMIARSESLRQETEAALRASENRFKTLCDQAPVGIYSTDSEGLCVYTNSRWRQMSGLSAAESLGHGWKQALHPDDRETVFEGWKTYLRQGTSWEYRLLTPKGEIRWIRALGGPLYSLQGEITGYVGTVEDITERKNAHRALQENEALNRAVLNSLPANIAVLDSNGMIQAINEEWLRFAEANGDPPARSVGIGANYLEVCRRASGYGSGDAERALAGIQDVLAGKLQSFRMQYPCDSATEKRWFYMLVTPLAGVTSGGGVVAHVDITERKQAQDAMKEALQQLQLITDNMPAGVIRCSRDLRYVWVSRSYAALLRRAGPEEIAGQSILDVVGQEFYGVVRPYIERALSGERVEYEIQVTYPDVGPRWIHAVDVPTKAPDQTIDGWIAVVGDVTERHEADQRLRESEERFRNMADAAPVMIWVSSPDKGCIFFNKVWLDFTGRTMEQESGNGWRAAVHPDDRDRCFAIYSSSFEARRGFQMEYRLRRADGEYRWLLNNGVPRFAVSGVFKGYIGSCIDITERKHEEELREELRRERERLAEARGLERFRLSFEEAPVGMALIRGDGVWLRVNRALCEMTGYTESELISRGRDITHPDDRAEESRLLTRILSGELAAGRLEERCLHKQGHTIYVLLSIAMVERDEAGRPVHFVAHVQDLTERKRVEQELEASRAQIVSSSRLSALGMMAGGIAHEINNPLAVIHASAANISRMAESGSVQVPPAVLKNNHRISQTADRISRIVRSLRHVARESSADEVRDTPVREIVDETLELCAERFRAHNIRLAVSAVDPEVVIPCREAQICQVLLNLLQNAFDELEDWEGERWVMLDVSSCPGWVIFSVSDSGPGIAREHRAHIMEAFFTTKPVGKGIGLGLSISRSIAFQHGGTLELDEESPHTCFRLKLRLSQRA
jgi:PAS domain S-box-containing protein